MEFKSNSEKTISQVAFASLWFFILAQMGPDISLGAVVSVPGAVLSSGSLVAYGLLVCSIKNIAFKVLMPATIVIMGVGAWILIEKRDSFPDFSKVALIS